MLEVLYYEINTIQTYDAITTSAVNLPPGLATKIIVLRLSFRFICGSDFGNSDNSGNV